MKTTEPRKWMVPALLNSAFKAADRRRHLSRSVPYCACGTQQVQLTDSSVVPAKWKCRECATKFEYEPED